MIFDSWHRQKTFNFKQIFDGSLEPKEIYRGILSRVSNANLIAGKTLIFFDEIQMCPLARTALKFLVEDGKYDFISSGSLLGINYKETEKISIPVGYEKDSDVIPVEVKSKNGSTVSLNEYIKKYNPKIAYKLIDGNVGFDGVKYTMPFYMGMFL